MTGLQEMLVAADPFGDKPALLLPAWPDNWEVAFKLHTAHQTIVEGHYRNGRPVGDG